MNLTPINVYISNNLQEKNKIKEFSLKQSMIEEKINMQKDFIETIEKNGKENIENNNIGYNYSMGKNKNKKSRNITADSEISEGGFVNINNDDESDNSGEDDINEENQDTVITKLEKDEKMEKYFEIIKSIILSSFLLSALLVMNFY